MAAIELEKFCVENIEFGAPLKKQFAGGIYHRIPIWYKKPEGLKPEGLKPEGLKSDGPKPELCIATNPLMTWGVQENRKQNPTDTRDGPVESYTLALAISDKQTLDVLNIIIQACRDHLNKLSVKSALGKFNMCPEIMKPLYYKIDKETGKAIEGSDPTLYPKLLTKFQKNKSADSPPVISSVFVDASGNSIDPLSLLGCRAKVIVALTIKDIYIGVTPSIQFKINDVIILERMVNQVRRLDAIFKNKYASQTNTSDDDVLASVSSNTLEDEQRNVSLDTSNQPSSLTIKNRIIPRQV